MTTNRNLSTPANGADVGTWDANLNGNFIVIDASLGTATTLSQTAAGTYPLTTVISGSGLSAVAQYQAAIFVVTGTLTGNVVYQIPAGVGGEWTINALALQPAGFTCTFTSATGGGTSVSLAGGSTAYIYCDGTNVRSQTVPGNYNAIVTNAGTSGALAAAQSGAFIELTSATSGSFALPSPATGAPVTFTFWTTQASQTLTASAGSITGPGLAAASSLVVPANAIVSLTSDGANWIAAFSVAPLAGLTTAPMPLITNANSAPLGWSQYNPATTNTPAASTTGTLSTTSTTGSATPASGNVITQTAYHVSGDNSYFRTNPNNGGWSAWQQVVSLTAGANAVPVGASASVVPGTVATATTPAFTAPSSGALMIAVTFSYANILPLPTTTTTTSLGGLVQLTGPLPLNTQVFWYYLPMATGQNTTITGQLVSTGGSVNMSVGVAAFFLPLA